MSGPTTQTCAGEQTAEGWTQGFTVQVTPKMLDGMGVPGSQGPHALGRQSASLAHGIGGPAKGSAGRGGTGGGAGEGAGCGAAGGGSSGAEARR